MTPLGSDNLHIVEDNSDSAHEFSHDGVMFIDDNRPNFEFGKKPIKDESYVDDGFVQEDLT